MAIIVNEMLLIAFDVVDSAYSYAKTKTGKTKRKKSQRGEKALKHAFSLSGIPLSFINKGICIFKHTDGPLLPTNTH